MEDSRAPAAYCHAELMKKNRRIHFFVGGPAFHPTADQARQIAQWLGPEYTCEIGDGLPAFEALDRCDLFVVMGLHWTGSHGTEWGDYHPLTDRHKKAFEEYAASGRPILAHHGGIASYDDWPRFGELVGVTWVWKHSSHSPYAQHTVRVLPTGHPVVEGVRDFTLQDELYYNLAITKGLEATVHAEAEFDGRRLPMVITAPRRVYLANGHDMAAFQCPAMKQLWINSVRWLLDS